MERGNVRSYDKNGGMGTISRPASEDVKFFADGVLGRDRNILKEGDQVWFEVENRGNIHTAINIRKT